MSQFESQFEADLYHARLAKLEKIADLATQTPAPPAAPTGPQTSAPATPSRAQAKYPNHFRFSPENIDVPAIQRQYDPLTAEALEAAKPHIAIAGRLIAIRLQGKAGFAQLQQGGQTLQIYVRKDNVGESAFELYKLLDLGDHVGVAGVLFRTRTNELTLQVQQLTFLSKAMLPLPDKFSGLGDIELRYRRRYLDLFTDTGDTPAIPATNPGAPGLASETWDEAAQNSEARPEPTRLPAREVFIKRAAILRSIREFFDTRNYLEVETPMLHTIAGGAAARPFKTHHNALDIPLSLRIAPELYLKRLVVGGLDRVYEINRNFRNEGVSTQHNPEFTMLEFYQAYANYHDLMALTQELITTVANEVNGTTITNFNGTDIDLSKWAKLSMREAIIKWWPAMAGPAPRSTDFTSAETLAECFNSAFLALQAHRAADGDTIDPIWIEGEPQEKQKIIDQQMMLEAYSLVLRNHPEKLGRVIADAFELLAEEHLIQPTIIYDFPLAVSPLSKVKPDEPDWVERFEFYIGGFEVGNAFSELNDPEDQRNRFLDQLKERDRGDDEAHAMDEDYVRALGYGLPPTAGEGIGIDRLTMILTGSRSIRDVILFPLMRPPAQPAPEEQATSPNPA